MPFSEKERKEEAVYIESLIKDPRVAVGMMQQFFADVEKESAQGVACLIIAISRCERFNFSHATVGDIAGKWTVECGGYRAPMFKDKPSELGKTALRSLSLSLVPPEPPEEDD